MAAANGHPLATNVVLALALAAASAHRLAQDGRLDWGTVPLTIGLSVPLVLRSRYRLAVLTALAAIAGVQWMTAEARRPSPSSPLPSWPDSARS